MEFNFYLGCDLSQDDFHFCLRNKSTILLQGVVENSPKAINRWINELKKKNVVDLKQTLFCMEHTGIYGLFLLRVLQEKELHACVESAMNIKLSLGLQRGKNDKIDAQRIAEYAMRYVDRLKLWKPRRPVIEELQLLIKLRERLRKARKDLSRPIQDAKRFHTKANYQMLLEGSEATLMAIKRDMESVEKKISELLQSDENLKRISDLVQSVDGIGVVTCSMIIVKTNEFQDITEAKKFACTAGIAPFERSSGSSVKGKPRVSHMAHKDLKSILHLCAVGTIGRKGELRDYYLRKVAEGKNKMSVINAVRNKLVHRVFAVVKNQTMYQKNYQYLLVKS